jgi:hypothetical protein
MAPWFLSERPFPQKLDGFWHELGPVDNAAFLPLLKSGRDGLKTWKYT